MRDIETFMLYGKSTTFFQSVRYTHYTCYNLHVFYLNKFVIKKIDKLFVKLL